MKIFSETLYKTTLIAQQPLETCFDWGESNSRCRRGDPDEASRRVASRQGGHVTAERTYRRFGNLPKLVGLMAVS